MQLLYYRMRVIGKNMARFDRLRQLEKRMERRRRISRVPLTRLRDRSDPFEALDAVQFKRRYHMYKDTALFIVGLIHKDLSAVVKRGAYIPPHLQFLMALRFFCDGSFQLTTSDLYNVSQPTISNIVKRVGTALAKLRSKFIRFPTFEEAESVRTAMYMIAEDCAAGTKGFPGHFPINIKYCSVITL